MLLIVVVRASEASITFFTKAFPASITVPIIIAAIISFFIFGSFIV
jgi:hypothetical protein